MIGVLLSRSVSFFVDSTFIVPFYSPNDKTITCPGDTVKKKDIHRVSRHQEQWRRVVGISLIH